MNDEFENMLIKKAKDGDVNAFESLIVQYEKPVYNIALRFLANEYDAKDISQEVFVKIYKGIVNFEENSSFYTWVYKVTHNTCIDFIRKMKNKSTISLDSETETQNGIIRQDLESPLPTPEEMYLTKEGVSEIQKAIAELSEEHKSLIILRDIQCLSYTEISEITQTPMGTIKSRLSRARNHLKNILISYKEQKIKSIV